MAVFNKVFEVSVKTTQRNRYQRATVSNIYEYCSLTRILNPLTIFYSYEMQRVFLVMLATTFISACSLFSNQPNPNINKSNKVIYTGVKPSDLNLRIRLEFHSTTEVCEKEVFLKGVRVPQHTSIVKIFPAGTAISAEFYIDEYLPGKCGWVPTYFLYSVDDETKNEPTGSWGSLVNISHNEGKKKLNLDFVCTKSKRSNFCIPKGHHWQKKFSLPSISASGGSINLHFTHKE